MKRAFLIFLSFALTTLIACSSSGKNQKKSKDPQVKSSQNQKTTVSVSYDTLTKRPISGFDYKKTSISMEIWKAWASQNLALIENIVPKIPETHALQVTGHADSRGPETPTKNKPGNLKISTERALTIYNLLLAKGIDSSKLVYKGVGSSQPLKGVNPKDPKQRRVSFVLISKE